MKKVFFLLFFVSLVFSITPKVTNDFVLTPVSPTWIQNGFSIKLLSLKNGVAFIDVIQYPDLKSVSEGTTFGPFTVLNVTAGSIKLRYENVAKDFNSVLSRATDKWATDKGFPLSKIVNVNLGTYKGKSKINAAFYREKVSITLLGLNLNFQKCLGQPFLITPSSD
ncbi:Uncharacterised protein [uncultured archaeon]|nr:Uncharacterised protein [uncultured archaeon]